MAQFPSVERLTSQPSRTLQNPKVSGSMGTTAKETFTMKIMKAYPTDSITCCQLLSVQMGTFRVACRRVSSRWLVYGISTMCISPLCTLGPPRPRKSFPSATSMLYAEAGRETSETTLFQ